MKNSSKDSSFEDDLDFITDKEPTEETDTDRVGMELDRMISLAGSTIKGRERTNWTTDYLNPPLNWMLVSQFCTTHAPIEEVASFFNMKVNDLKRRCIEDNGISYSDFETKFNSTGKIAIRAKQFDSAMKGNPSMLSFLGKNILKQSDVTQNTNEEGNNVNLSLSQLHELLSKKKEEDVKTLDSKDYFADAYKNMKESKEAE